jgi:PAS domain S-box-containing protein
MKDTISGRPPNKAFTGLSLAVRGARLQFAVGVALVSVVPALSLLYLVGHEWGGDGSARTWGVSLFGVAISILLGYALLSKYPVTVIKLRAYVDNMVKGEMPDRISLFCSEDDVTAIESGMNFILSRLRGRLQTVEAQNIAIEERHTSILQTAMDGFWLVDMQGRLLEVNAAYCRMSGYSAQELLAMRIPDLEVAETAAATAARIQKIMAQGEDRFESRHRRKDGSILDVEVSVQ